MMGKGESDALRFSSIILLTILVVSGIVSSFQVPQEDGIVQGSLRDFAESDYTAHPKIMIWSNSDFETQGWPGNGTQSNPYRIENLNITGSSPALGIQGTDVFFVVRNCIVASDDWGYSIDLSSVQNGEFDDCILRGPYGGIEMDSCTDIEFENCTFLEAPNETGSVDATGCDRINIVNSTFENQMKVNICNDWLLQNNSITESGVTLYACTNFTILENEFSDEGLNLRGSGPAPSEIPEYYNHTIDDNMVDGRPLLYLKGSSGATIPAGSYGQVILFDCSSTQVSGGTIIRGGQPVQVTFSSDCVVSNIEIIRGNYGISGVVTKGLRIEDCSLIAPLSYGIYCYDCEDVVITNCEIDGYYTPQGIAAFESDNVRILDNSIAECNNIGVLAQASPFVIIDGNIVDNCKRGVVLISDNGSITNNDVRQASSYGIYVESSDCTLQRNSIRECQTYGIWIKGNNSLLTKNFVIEGAGTGILVAAGARLNRIFDNSVGWNSVVNAYDNGTSNEWDDGVSVGNRWSDHSGTGVYNIDGTAGSVDHFPSILVADVTPPYIGPIADIMIPIATSVYIFNWTVIDEYPLSFEIYLNGSLADSGAWDGSAIVYEFGVESLGTSNVTLVVFDMSGNMAYDTVMVNVVVSTPASGPFIVDPLVVAIGLGGIVAVVVLVAFLRKRK